MAKVCERMKIALVRGASLNKYEMQYYEPLLERHDLVAFGARNPAYEVGDIKIPIMRLICSGNVWGKIPGGVKFLYRLDGDPQRMWGLEDCLDGYKIVHTAEISSFYTYQALRAKMRGKVEKVVATVSESVAFNSKGGRQRELKEFNRENLDFILAISSKAREAMVMEGYPERKIEVVPHGLDLEVFGKKKKNKKLMRKLGLEEDEVIVLSVGRLVWEKGFYDFLLAAKELVEDRTLGGKRLRFVIVGEGKEKERLEVFINRLGLRKKVVLAGGVGYSGMVDYYNLADVFVLASIPIDTWEEQFGMVVVEAMACEVPVIVSKGGGVSETVGESGLLVEPRDWLGLSKGMKKMIVDRRVRKKLVKKGKKRVESKYDKSIVASKIESIYKKLLESV